MECNLQCVHKSQINCAVKKQMINHVDFEFIYRAVLRNAIKPAQLTLELVGKPEVLYTDSGSVNFRKCTINPKSKMINTPSQMPNIQSPKDSRVSQPRGPFHCQWSWWTQCTLQFLPTQAYIKPSQNTHWHIPMKQQLNDNLEMRPMRVGSPNLSTS